MKKMLPVLALSSITLVACSKPTPQASEDIQSTQQTQTTTSNPPASAPINSADSAHNAQNSLDWAGEYKGLFPCADCEGIETKLELKPDHTYTLTEEYKGKGDGKKFKTEGKFEFDTTGTIITLDKASEQRKFFVGENFLEARDRETGAKIDTNLNYKLSKELN